MTVGLDCRRVDLIVGTSSVRDRVGERSIFALWAYEGSRLYCDGMLDDLFSLRRRLSVSPRAVAMSASIRHPSKANLSH